MRFQSHLKVYSSNRSLMQSLNEGELLCPHMLMGEFFTQLVIVDEYRALPQAMRLPLMMETLKDCAKELERVKFVFEKSFLAFLESSHFLFGFLNELAQSQVSISEIPTNDIYGDYDDHLRVLEWVEKRYKERLNELKYYDGLILPTQAKPRINEAFISHFEYIDLYIEGIVSKAHLELLSKVATYTKLRVHFWLDTFNINLPFLPSYILDKCKPFNRYSILYDSGEILSTVPIKNDTNVQIYSFTLRISQVTLIFYYLKEWLNNGIKEEDIVVIVPDEHFIRYLALFDKAHNLNFAMGKNITHTKVYIHLQNMLNAQKECKDMHSLPYSFLCEEVQASLASFDDRDSKKVRQYINEIFYMWENLYSRDSTYVEFLELLLQALQDCNIDDVAGGKIRVMGVLESRGFSYQKAIIVDCNDGIMPSIADSDLFLNSKLRRRLNMPTNSDKERLQKHYYYGIFSTANEVIASYVKNEEKHKSLILEELSQFDGFNFSEDDGDRYFRLLPEGKKVEYYEDNMKGRLPYALTPSKLKVLLECPRRYYYKYVEGLCESNTDSAFMGNILHECLESVYRMYVSHRVKLNSTEIYRNVCKWFEAHVAESATENVKNKLLQREINGFLNKYQKDIEVEILYIETEMDIELCGYKFKVRPDRIQKVGECIEIIDYKYRNNFKVEKADVATDFALILYMLAFKKANPNYASLPTRLCYWDIKTCEIKEEECVADKCKVLQDKLSAFNADVVFSKCDNRKFCRYCEFTELCDR